jgi:hypothetical protein
MDLLGRKLGLNKGKPVMDLLTEIQKSIAMAKEAEGLEDLAVKMEEIVDKLGEVALHMGTTAMSPKMLNAFAFAHPFMEVCGDVVMAWLLLWRAAVAAQKLAKKPKKKDTAFYEGQIKSAEFFIYSIIPITVGKMKAILTTNGAAVDIDEKSFGG